MLAKTQWLQVRIRWQLAAILWLLVQAVWQQVQILLLLAMVRLLQVIILLLLAMEMLFQVINLALLVILILFTEVAAMLLVMIILLVKQTIVHMRLQLIKVTILLSSEAMSILLPITRLCWAINLRPLKTMQYLWVLLLTNAELLMSLMQ